MNELDVLRIQANAKIGELERQRNNICADLCNTKADQQLLFEQNQLMAERIKELEKELTELKKNEDSDDNGEDELTG